MKTKICSKCKRELSLECFGKCDKHSDGLRRECNECRSEYYQKNKEYIKKKSSKYYHENREAVSKKNKEYRDKNKEKIKLYLENNKEHIKKRTQKYYNKNKKKIQAKRKVNKIKRIEKDPIYKFMIRLRGNIDNAFRRRKLIKNSPTYVILGCSIEYFLTYIESQFVEGMSFDNYGEWHLDHIVPLCSAKSLEDVIKLNHYTNFQPLWKKDNYEKKKSDIKYKTKI